jgi:predicted HTH transcriptional regulator
LGHLFLLSFIPEKDALFIRVYPAIFPFLSPGRLIGMTGITDRHETESLIGMARIMQLHELCQQVGASEAAQPPSNEDKIFRIIQRKEKPTKRQIAQFTKLSYDDVKEGLNTLLLSNKITVKPNGRKDGYEILRKEVNY